MILSRDATKSCSEADFLLGMLEEGDEWADDGMWWAAFVREALTRPLYEDIPVHSGILIVEDSTTGEDQRVSVSVSRWAKRYEVRAVMEHVEGAGFLKGGIQMKLETHDSLVAQSYSAYDNGNQWYKIDLQVMTWNPVIQLLSASTPDKDYLDSVLDEGVDEFRRGRSEIYFPVSRQTVKREPASMGQFIERLAREAGAMLGTDVVVDKRFEMAMEASETPSAARTKPTQPASPRVLPVFSEKFESERLAGRDFSNMDLRGSSFHRCDLTGCNFSGANLQGIRMTQCSIDGANFESANLQKVKFFGLWHSFENGPEVAGSTMTKCDLSNADMRSAMLAGCDLRGSNFEGADLRGTDFRGTHSEPPLPAEISPMDAKLTIDATVVRWDESTVWPSTIRPT